MSTFVQSAMNPPSDTSPCPCRARDEHETFGECCGPLVLNGLPAATPEALMRSRYTAFAMRDAEHLWRTWHPSTRQQEIGELAGMQWQGLTILDADGDADGTGTVTFEARFVTDSGERGVVREHSRFAQRAGRWFYVDGDELA